MEKPIKVLMTETPEGPENDSILRTPSGEANVQVQTWDIWKQLGVRVLRSWVQYLFGHLLGAGVGVIAAPVVAAVLNAGIAFAAEVGVPVQPVSTGFFTLLSAAFFASLGPTFLCLLQNFIELSAGWDKTIPKMRA